MNGEIINKKAAVFLAFRDFRDEEYFIVREVLEAAGLKVFNVSNSPGKAIGVEGGEVEIDFTFEALKAGEYDTLVFVGGPGCLRDLDNEIVYNLAKGAFDSGVLLAAICISPVILAKAGLLKGKKATVWSSSMEKTSVETLKAQGADYVEREVVVDGNIITAIGPEAAQEFAQTIVEELEKKSGRRENTNEEPALTENDK